MVIPKEILTDFKEVYEKATKLVNEESKNDPATDPYRSHYAARQLLEEMKENLKNALVSVQADEGAKEASDDEFTYQVILASVNRDLGRIFVFTEEVSTGERLLHECLELMEQHKMKREAIIPYMGALNEIGIVYANRQEYKQSFDKLKESEALYKAYKESAAGEALAITDIFGLADEIEVGKGSKEFESLYTYCTFYLAQVYGHLGDLEQSADYCHMTLKRQLAAKSYEPIDFSLNSATLSQYYIGQQMWAQARHHLAAATLIMAEYEEKMLTPEMTEQQRTDTTETFKHRYADVARCWAKYGLALLAASKDRLYDDSEEKLSADTERLQIDPNKYKFPDLDLSTYESRISAEYCLTFDDAKQIYHFVINWLDQAKEYYKPDTEASEYAKIIKDFAELYQHIAFFEEDPINQFKMQKRRAKYYDDLLDLLNPVFYMNICRECWYGAGLAYISMLDIKLDLIKEKPGNPPPQDLAKVNQICQKAIKHFQDYIKSYSERDSDAIKSNIELDEERSVLYAYFHLGRLHYKLITPDHNLQLENMTNSLKFYKRFTDECAKREEAAKTLQSEIGVCREMVNLLPLKIKNIKKRIEN